MSFLKYLATQFISSDVSVPVQTQCTYSFLGKGYCRQIITANLNSFQISFREKSEGSRTIIVEKATRCESELEGAVSLGVSHTKIFGYPQSIHCNGEMILFFKDARIFSSLVSEPGIQAACQLFKPLVMPHWHLFSHLVQSCAFQVQLRLRSSIIFMLLSICLVTIMFWFCNARLFKEIRERLRQHVFHSSICDWQDVVCTACGFLASATGQRTSVRRQILLCVDTSVSAMICSNFGHMSK